MLKPSSSGRALRAVLSIHFAVTKMGRPHKVGDDEG